MVWNVVLMIIMAVGFGTKLAPSIASVCAAALAWRMLPGTTGTLVCGLVLLAAGTMARARQRARR